MQKHVFPAMGTQIELLSAAGEAGAAFDAAEAEFHRLEAIMTRFRPDSELSALNEAGSLEAGPELVEVVGLAVDGRERTNGRFDPTVHDAVAGAGYDRTFKDLPDEGPPLKSGRPCGGKVRITGSRIDLGEGVKLDLGGIGKGYAAERAASLLAEAGPCLVNAGGDVALRGTAWPIGIETSDGSLTLALENGALATSGRDRRTWRRGGRELHHLIDPGTGEPTESDLLRATVVAGDAVEAEIWAKALFLAGSDDAALEADERRLPCLLVTAGGETRLAGGLR
jgi:thiamine biosynthesis lipoprotein